MSDYQLKRGDLVSGVYRVKAMLGRGGFAEVYRVEHIELHRELALKLFSPRNRQDEKDEQRQQRFLREARAIHDLSHPNIVRLHHYGLDEERRPFLVMDYVEGRPLGLMAGRMEPTQAVRVVAEVLDALHAVHQTGLLHRDVKPSNVMLGEEGGREWVKLIDFGVAKHYDRSRRDTEWLTLTKADTFIGTPAYTAPELLLNQDPSPCSDIYSAGLVLYELVFGERAVSGENSIEVLSYQLQPHEFELPDEPALPPAVRAVLEKMIAKEPAQRFATARETAAALRASLDPDAVHGGFEADGASTREPPSVTIASAPSGADDPAESLDDHEVSAVGPGNRRTVMAVVAVAALLLLGATFVLLGSLGQDPVEPGTGVGEAGTEAAVVNGEAEPMIFEAPDEEHDEAADEQVTGGESVAERAKSRKAKRKRRTSRRKASRHKEQERRDDGETIPFKPEPVD